MGFRFRQFNIDDSHTAMKVGTDGVLLGAWAAVCPHGRVLDAGCGSGLLSLAVAQRTVSASITGVDIDAGATGDAARNFAASPWKGRLSAHLGDFTALDGPFDLIISNPPYFETGMVAPDGRRALARHRGSLNAHALIEYAARVLSPDGSLAMITPAADEDAIVYRAELNHLKLRRFTSVIPGSGKEPSRFLWQFARHDGHIEKSSLTIKLPDNNYSIGYRSLVEPFYLYLPG